MAAPAPPKPNTQALSWFFGEHEKATLVLNPKYQRNPIWSDGQKCFLIDSLISGCPIPQVYINVVTKGSGKQRETIYEVVDGQQRLKTILDFMNDKWPLISLKSKSYPISEYYIPLIGKKFSQLPGDLQDSIWNYPLSVQELRGIADAEIRSLFRRLNYVVERLTKQEMRHSQYFGEFVKTVEELAKDDFWNETEIFTRRDYQRMRDIEFISELFILIIDGVQDQQKTLDDFYAMYDVEFSKKRTHIKRFNQIIEILKPVSDFIRESRFSKKADFYALFGAVNFAQKRTGKFVEITKSAISKLKRLEKSLDKPLGQLSGVHSQYHATVIEGPNKKPKRVVRIQIIESILS